MDSVDLTGSLWEDLYVKAIFGLVYFNREIISHPQNGLAPMSALQCSGQILECPELGQNDVYPPDPLIASMAESS